MPYRPKSYSDEELLTKLKDGSLPPLDFNHEAHVRLAWICHHDTSRNTFHQVSTIIRDYAEAIGEAQIYHETLTYAAVKIISKLIEQSTASTFSAFIQENQILLKDLKSLILKHYSQKTLDSNDARTEIILPDVQPL